MRRILTATLLGLLATGTSAKGFIDDTLAGGTACLLRVYDDAHMASHPAQNVVQMALAPDADALVPFGAEDIRLQLSFILRAQDELYTRIAYCTEAGGGLDCGLEGDGGNFRLTARDGGAVLLTVGDQGISVEGSADFAYLDPVKGDDREFLLRPDALGCN